ncbi:MAG: threonine/serine exporter family protein [Propioniciclava sp.]|uniref:threonine/serine ThrE exporter family protein n=1 Tax=Propioniciclava sp. TaxID=2038686 RepID=UPI0039E39FB5
MSRPLAPPPRTGLVRRSAMRAATTAIAVACAMGLCAAPARAETDETALPAVPTARTESPVPSATPSTPVASAPPVASASTSATASVPAEPAPPAPSPSAVASPSAQASAAVPSPAVSAPATATASARASAPPVLQGSPPASASRTTTPLTWWIAVIVLVICALLVSALPDRRPRGATTAPDGEPPTQSPEEPGADTNASISPAPSATPEELLASLETAGEAMIDAGHSVTSVEIALADIARVNGAAGTEIIVLPTALIISSRSMTAVHTSAVVSGRSDLNLAQIDAVDTVVDAARTGNLAPARVRAHIAAARAMPLPYTSAQRIAAYTLLSASLAVLLGASWTGTALAAGLGLGVGTVLTLSEHSPARYRALLTVALSYVVSITVLVVSTVGLDPGVLPSLIAPLVMMLPGGLLTTGAIELSTGQMMSGAGRLAAGFMQLALLAAGVVAASALVGVPHLDLSTARDPIGTAGPWVAVGLFGLGITVYRCARRRAIGWILLVLYTAYGVQVVTDLVVGGIMSAFIAAVAITPVTILIARQPGGPAPFVSFLPAFWLMVPGALGLVGVASLLDGDTAGINTLIATASTMLAIALGTLAGTALIGGLRVRERSLL